AQAPRPEQSCHDLRHARRRERPPRAGISMKIDLTGKSALVTGSTRGIGRAIAGTLAACGARVVVVGRDKAKADARALETPGARGFACDVARPAEILALVEDVEKEFGALDILVNNAGITKHNLMLRIKD